MHEKDQIFYEKVLTNVSLYVIFKVLFAEAKKRQIMVSDLMLEIITEAAENIKQKKGK
ncbi:hypothetical protein ACEZUP_004983 [Escherichia coli]